LNKFSCSGCGALIRRGFSCRTVSSSSSICAERFKDQCSLLGRFPIQFNLSDNDLRMEVRKEFWCLRQLPSPYIFTVNLSTPCKLQNLFNLRLKVKPSS
jgi:hypothetical protein